MATRALSFSLPALVLRCKRCIQSFWAVSESDNDQCPWIFVYEGWSLHGKLCKPSSRGRLASFRYALEISQVTSDLVLCDVVTDVCKKYGLQASPIIGFRCGFIINPIVRRRSRIGIRRWA